MGWAFLWLMVALKVPIAALLYIVWWAVQQTDEHVPGNDGGSGVRPHPSPVPPRGPSPRRRGPHGAPAQQAPAPRMRVMPPGRGVSAGRH